MRILTLWQPWASLIAVGFKHYETRHWTTNYRGKLAIHAAKRPVDREELAAISYNSVGHLPWEQISAIDYPLGGIVAIADLTQCLYMVANDGDPPPRNQQDTILISSMSPLEKAVGNWEQGRYAWRLENVIVPAEPIPYKGSQGLSGVSEEVQQQIEAMLEGANHAA